MSKESREFIERLKEGKEPTALAAVKEAGGKLWDALAPIGDHGRAELASALFTGSAHVTYGWGGKEAEQAEVVELVAAPEQGLQGPEVKPAEQELGGREM